MEQVFKISVYIPEDFVKELTEKVNEEMEPLYPGYDFTFSMTKVTGMWRPLEGSDPFIGKIGEISVEEEVKVDFTVKEKDLRNIIRTIVSVHPYEEPAIDVVPMYAWKSIIQ